MLARNRGSSIHRLGLDVCFDDYHTTFAVSQSEAMSAILISWIVWLEMTTCMSHENISYGLT